MFFQTSLAQIEDNPDVWGGDDFGSLHIPTFTPVYGQYLRGLFIFVTFSDDNEIGPPTSIWAKPDPNSTQGTRPINPHTVNGNIIAVNEESPIQPFMTRYEQYTISDYFSQMSGGQLDFIGDEVYFRLPYPSTYYQNTLQWKRPQLNSYILQYVHDNLGVNFRRYDNWHREGNNWVWGGDNEAEMIVIQFRKIPGGSSGYEGYYWNYWGMCPGGEAHLFGDSYTSMTLDGIYISNDDGITATQGINKTSHLELVLEHEISHHIFGDIFNHPGYNQWHVSIGMMTEGHNTSTYCMIPMERAMTGLNWVTPMLANPQNSSQTFTLRDEFEYGDILKIPIPKANSNDPQEYFWVTNHQKKSRYDGLTRGSNTCYQINSNEIEPICDVGKGLYIFHESDKNCNNNINGYGQYGARHFPFDIKSAKGRWNWDLDTTVIVPEFNNSSFDIQKTSTKNIISGVNTYNKYFLRSNYIWSAQFLTRNPCWVPPNYKIAYEFHGDGKDDYNKDYSEILSPYSNSSSNNYQNQEFNTGVTIRLLSQNPTTGEMQVKVYYDDNLAIYECPPAKPQNLKANGTWVEPDVSFYPHLQWDANLEPDFIEDAYYKIYRGISYNCSNEPVYYYIGSVPCGTNEFTDFQMLLFTSGQGRINCGNSLKTVSYKISAVDNSPTAYESVKSERGFVQGYFQGCIMDPGNDRFTLSSNSVPKEFYISQNYPNPFNPITNIKYDLPKDVFVTIKMYDLIGREIKTLVNEYKTAGSYLVSFNGSEFASGVYFYRMQAGSFIQTKKMIILK